MYSWYYQVPDFDPFLMLDYFVTESSEESPGFPWHPHKGIETITYMLRGKIEHKDSIGNGGIIGRGRCAVDDGGGRHISSGDAPARARRISGISVLAQYAGSA